MKIAKSCGGWALALVGAGLLIGHAGCRSASDRLQFDTYRQIQPALWSQADVAAALGEPSAMFEGKWLYERPDQHLRAIIDFDTSGRVTRTQWIDGRTGAWEDTGGPAANETPPESAPPPTATGTGKP